RVRSRFWRGRRGRTVVLLPLSSPQKRKRMSTHVLRGAAAGVALAAALAFAAPAMASYSATVDGTTLRIAGDGASDKLALVADPTNVIVDLGEDGTADFTFPRSAFP